jgi:hypothetical protein
MNDLAYSTASILLWGDLLCTARAQYVRICDWAESGDARVCGRTERNRRWPPNVRRMACLRKGRNDFVTCRNAHIQASPNRASFDARRDDCAWIGITKVSWCINLCNESTPAFCVRSMLKLLREGFQQRIWQRLPKLTQMLDMSSAQQRGT